MKIYLIKDIMHLLRASRPTVYRWLAESRKGVGYFPLPISQDGQQLRWNADDIEAFCQSRGVPQPPVVVTSPKQQIKRTEEHRNRQEATAAVLAKHGILGTKKPQGE